MRLSKCIGLFKHSLTLLKRSLTPVELIRIYFTQSYLIFIAKRLVLFRRILYFFGKFVLVFTNLALFDNWDKNFRLTLTQFKNIIVDSSGMKSLVNARFLAKYFTYLYEDSFENMVWSYLSFN